MQKLSTRIFVLASLLFGVTGILIVLTAPDRDADATDFNKFLMRLLLACVFIILPSFAISVAAKYLNGKS